MKTILISVVAISALVLVTFLYAKPEFADAEADTTAPGNYPINTRLRYGALEVLPPTESGTGERLPFIIGGDKAQKGQFPWMVFLTLDNTSEVVCSGALIRDSWVLTAAHCYPGIAINDDAYIGFISEEGSGGEVRNIIDIELHSNPDQHDIALLKLESPSSLLPLKLNPDYLANGQSVTIIGFGRDGKTPPGSDLRYAAAKTVPFSSCADTSFFQERLCVGDPTAGICWGDSGGPLLLRTDQEWSLVGVANEISPATQCGKNSLGLRVGSFARGSTYVDWITGIVDA